MTRARVPALRRGVVYFAASLIAVVGCSAEAEPRTGADDAEVSATEPAISWCASNGSCGASPSGALPKHGRIAGTVTKNDGRYECDAEIVLRPLHGPLAGGQTPCDASFVTMQDIATAATGTPIGVEIDVAVRCDTSHVHFDASFRQYACHKNVPGPFANVRYPGADGASLEIEAHESNRAKSDYLYLGGVPPEIDRQGGEMKIDGFPLRVKKLSFVSSIPD